MESDEQADGRMKSGRPTGPGESTGPAPNSPDETGGHPFFRGILHRSDDQITLSDAAFVAFSSSAQNRKKFLVAEVNPTACGILGLPGRSLLGRTLDDLCEPPMSESLSNLFADVLRTGESRGFLIKESAQAEGKKSLAGSVFRIDQDRIAMIFNKAGQANNLAQMIIKGKREWELTVDAMPDIITIMDKNLRILRANRAAHAMFGYQFGQLVGRKCHDIFQGSPNACPSCPVVSTATAEGPLPRHDYFLNEILGRKFHVTASPIYDENNELQMIVHIAHDVTDTIEQEEERRRLSAAIEQTNEVVVLTDRRGVIQYVNPAFTKSTGYSREDAVGHNMSLLKSGKHDRAFYRQLWETILSGEVWSGQMINRRKDGSLFSEICTISPIFDDNREISSFVSVKRDISREEMLERQLQQAIKLESIGTLAGGIAHDFNNILSAILGYAQIAKGQLESTDPVLYSINHILSAGDRAADLIKQILTFSRQENSREPFKPLKVQLIAKEALKLLRSSTPATIKLTQKIDSECPPILADASQIHQVIMNLCTNAIQAIGAEYGEISIRLTELQSDEESRRQLPMLNDGRYLHLSVADNGCGMHEQILQRIFDPFFTTKPKDHGTGLGLSVVHGIVKKHKGEITVHSSVGKGTVFDVFFPIVPIREEVKQQSREAVRGGTERILLIDDELQLAEFLKVALERLGYRVTPFTDPIEAVRYFRSKSNDYDLVVTDMTMPNMTGAELAREMLALRPNLPIIMITGYNENISKEKALRLGITAFMNKPLKKDDLALTVRKILDHGSHSDH